MRSVQWLRLTPVLFTAAAMAYAQRSPARVKPASIESVRWLAGCFEMNRGASVIEEVRLGPRGGSMLGMGRTTTPKGLVEYELTLIAERDGGLVYEAHPSGQPATVFKARLVTPDRVVFAAPAHDYPQFVGYARIGSDSVLAWIDGTMGGQKKRVSFPYRRVPCPA
jgi:hypothetical protein